ALLWETHDKINRKLYKAVRQYERLSDAVALDCLERFTQTVYGLLIGAKNKKSFFEKLNIFFSRNEINNVLKDIVNIFPKNSNVKFLNDIICESNFLYYKTRIYFK